LRKPLLQRVIVEGALLATTLWAYEAGPAEKTAAEADRDPNSTPAGDGRSQGQGQGSVGADPIDD